jgi:tetratricopeptide (TPR) repeat protein
LFVGAVTIAIGSTMVAMRVIKERDKLQESLAVKSKALDDTVLAAATSSRLKGPANAQARQEIFTPAIQGYQQVVGATMDDPERLDEAAAASFRSAALQAKMGAGACVGSLQSGIEAMRKMGAANYDVERFPSLNDTALKMTAPMDWGIMKDSEMRVHAVGLLFTFQQAIGILTDLAAQYPQATVFRSDLAGLQRVSATLQTAVGRTPFALEAWLGARDQLESLLRDQPTNTEFQMRLVEALVGAANLQKQAGETEAAIANFKRAVEVRQQMADANPEDKTLADELAKVKSNLEKLQPAAEGASASAAAPAEVPQ